MDRWVATMDLAGWPTGDEAHYAGSLTTLRLVDSEDNGIEVGTDLGRGEAAGDGPEAWLGGSIY